MTRSAAIIGKICSIPLLMLLCTAVSAQTDELVIAANPGPLPVTAHIRLPADYVAIEVSLSSDARYPAQRVKQISEYVDLIRKAADKEANIEIRYGNVTLSSGEGSGSLSLLKRGSYSDQSAAGLYLFSKLSEYRDVLTATQAIYKFVRSLPEPDDTSIWLGTNRLAMSSPEQYRDKILHQVRDEIAHYRELFSSKGQIVLRGLENPVQVQAWQENRIRLYIDYSLELAN